MLMELWKRAPRLDETSIFGFLKYLKSKPGSPKWVPKGGGLGHCLEEKVAVSFERCAEKNFRGKFYDPPFGTPFSGPFWERFLRVSLAPDIDQFGSDKHIDLKSHLGAILGSILKLSL